MTLKSKKSFVLIASGVVVLFKSGLEVKTIPTLLPCVNDDLFVKNLGITFSRGLALKSSDSDLPQALGSVNFAPFISAPANSLVRSGAGSLFPK